MAAQSAEMHKLGTVTNEMIEQVGELTDAFHQIDAEQTRANIVHANIVKSALVHVQGTQTPINESVGNVQTVPDANVINLVSNGTDGGSGHDEGQENDGIN